VRNSYATPFVPLHLCTIAGDHLKANVGGNGVCGQGNEGGTSPTYTHGGGGGGAGERGGDAVSSLAGPGGDGRNFSMLYSDMVGDHGWFGGGGGGGEYGGIYGRGEIAAGGRGGGGSGAVGEPFILSTAGTANTGGGGKLILAASSPMHTLWPSADIRAFTHVHSNSHVYAKHIHTRTRTHARARIHTHKHTHTHTHIHTHTHTCIGGGGSDTFDPDLSARAVSHVGAAGGSGIVLICYAQNAPPPCE